MLSSVSFAAAGLRFENTFKLRPQSTFCLGHRRTERNADPILNRDWLKGPLSCLCPQTDLTFHLWYARDPSTQCWCKTARVELWSFLDLLFEVYKGGLMERNRLKHFPEVSICDSPIMCSDKQSYCTANVLLSVWLWVTWSFLNSSRIIWLNKTQLCRHSHLVSVLFLSFYFFIDQK